LTRTPFSFRFLVILLGIVGLVFPAALIGQLGLVSHLNSILAEIQRTRQSQLLAGELLRAQIDEETAIRGYLVSGQTDFLGPFRNGTTVFPQASAELRRRVLVTRDTGDDDIIGALDDAERANATWLAAVARPVLMHKATIAEVPAGKALTDRVRRDVETIDTRLAADYAFWSRKRDAILRTAFAVAVAANVVIIVELLIFAAVVIRMRREIDRDRDVINALQDATESTLHDHPAFDVGSAYFSATEGTRVGGDVFDVYRLDATSAMIVIGDVSGKGVEAAVDTTLIRYGLRAFAAESRDTGDIVTRFNALYAAAEKPLEAFVVLFVGIFDGRNNTLQYTSAGHEAAFVRRSGDLEQLPPTNTIAGIDPAAIFTGRIVSVGPADTIVLATDGLTEARDPRGAFCFERATPRMDHASEPNDAANASRRSVRVRPAVDAQSNRGRLSDPGSAKETFVRHGSKRSGPPICRGARTIVRQRKHSFIREVPYMTRLLTAVLASAAFLFLAGPSFADTPKAVAVASPSAMSSMKPMTGSSMKSSSMSSTSKSTTKKCPTGQSYVHGYTKADGTKVAGYCRKSS
jgi:CHASE3 domain sensor protein